MRFKGKNGLVMWLLLVLVAGCGVFFVTLKDAFGSVYEFWGIIGMHVAVLALVACFMVRNSIYVSDKEIRVCFGMTTSVIAIDTIVSMKKTINAIASSGASLDRVEVAFMKGTGRKVIYVSPQDKDGFMDAVRARNEEIKIYN